MTKTPVGALHEVCTKMKVTEQYQLVRMISRKEYECEVSFNNVFDHIVVKGVGKSKKEAKHTAAEEALKSISLSMEECGHDKVNFIDMSVVKSPFIGRCTENYEKKLKEICIANSLPLPEYTTVFLGGLFDKQWEIGDAPCNERPQFYNMQCKISSLIEIGESRTKREARQIASCLMIDKIKVTLKGLFVEPLPADEISSESQATAGSNGNGAYGSGESGSNGGTDKIGNDSNQNKIEYNLFKYTKVLNENKKVNWKISIANYHKIMQEEEFYPLTYVLRNKLKIIDEAEIKNLTSPKNLLENICSLSDLKFVFVRYNNNDDGSGTALVGLNLLTLPSWTTVGVGATEQEAQIDAVKNMLCFLKKIMC